MHNKENDEKAKAKPNNRTHEGVYNIISNNPTTRQEEYNQRPMASVLVCRCVSLNQQRKTAEHEWTEIRPHHIEGSATAQGQTHKIVVVKAVDGVH